MHSSKREPLRGGSIVPSFRGGYLERFLYLVEGIDELGSSRQREAIERELQWCRSRSGETLDHLRYRATLMVLRDLLGQGWRIRFRQKSIFLVRPDYSHGGDAQLDPSIVKAQIREALSEERLSKLELPATRRFIGEIERETKRHKSILDLIADGAALASELQRMPVNATIADLRSVVSPYLQLIEADARDEHTGVRLLDIWRYFRYLWAIPYLATPGRSLHYLVRDAAREFHPVIGIAALGNSVVQLSDRDRAIGWSVEAIQHQFERRSRLVKSPSDTMPGLMTEALDYLETEEDHQRRLISMARRLSKSLMRAIESELSLISTQDLVRKSELVNPTVKTINHLLAIAASSERERRAILSASQRNGQRLKRTELLRDWRGDSQKPLFRRKRAQALADLFYARLEFEAEQLQQEPLEAIRRLLETERGRKALRIALYANKKARIGSNMMDIIVCGAVPPYGELLGGKLVAMLMASPQVVRDYQRRYAGQTSEISSRLAGRPVVRTTDLVFLGTTSLYHVGSSQYERIKIPTLKGKTIAYRRMGLTEGYGSIVLSGETSDLLRELLVRSQGMRRVNNIFGEGVSARMRLLRDGLVELGIPQDIVLRHSCPRIIYGIELASNAMEYLRGEVREAKYYFSPSSYKSGTAHIIDHWLLRWLAPRSRRPETLLSLAQMRKDDILLSKELAKADMKDSEIFMWELANASVS